ncbi:MAG: FAD-dependent oxidoreductase [Curvibacter sp.]|nr:MAG: FAD-dependent oxidoreductase [Curvibacter sp.]
MAPMQHKATCPLAPELRMDDASTLPQRLLASSALPYSWADLPAWTVLDTAFDSLAPFLHCWHTWLSDARRPRMLHYVGILPVARAHHLPALARQAAQATPQWVPLADSLAASCAGLGDGQHRILLAQGQLSLTLCVGDTAALLAEQNFLANTVWVHGTHALWDKWRIKSLARCSQRGAYLAIYSLAPGAQANLNEAGFVDVQHDGNSLQARFQPRWSLGARDLTLAYPTPQRCTVIGAGISGASVAYALARRGWQVVVLDQHAAPACGASGLPAGLVVPHISADDSPRSRMSRVGARLMLQHAKALLQEGSDWQRSGVQELNLEQGSAHWHAEGAWIRPSRLVQAWLHHPAIRCHFGARVTGLQQHAGVWRLSGDDGAIWSESEVVVLANATGCVPLMMAPKHAHHLGVGLVERLEMLHAVHGTVSYAVHQRLPPADNWPTHPVNGHGNFLPQVPLDGGVVWLAGSTFEPDRIPEQAGHRLAPVSEQHRANAQRLCELLPAVGAELASAFARSEVQHWSATRCVTHDRLPWVGALQDTTDGVPPSLWIHAGMGARGLTFSALGAELLVACIGGEPWPIEGNLARSLDVRRPKRRRNGGA